MDASTTSRGQRLLPSLVDELAEKDPSRVLYSVCKTTNPSDGFQDVDARAFSRAVNRCAHYLKQKLGVGKNFPTLLYMGSQDLVPAFLILAAIKTGYKLLLNSPRNTLEAHLNLLEQTDCHTFLMPPDFRLPVVKQILSSRQMEVLTIPGPAHWLEEGDVEPYPYKKSFAEAESDPFIVLHTSGTTGLPKPIVSTHGTYTPVDRFSGLPALGYQRAWPEFCAGSRLYTTFPLFHAGGIMLLLPSCLYLGITIVFGPYPPSADVVNGVIVHGNVQHACFPPMTLIDLAEEPEYVENLSRLKTIAYGGGPCPKPVGDLISTKTCLVSCIGSTEAGFFLNQIGDPEDWEYTHLSPLVGSEYRPFADDLYEHFVVRDEKLSAFQGIFKTFPSLQEWPMKDLYSKHPTKDGVWLHRGRADDIIVFSTGEKLNPIDMELLISAHPGVSAAVVVGQGQIQASLLIELASASVSDTSPIDNSRDSLLDMIWPTVKAANDIAPSHAQVHRDMILFSSPEKPFLKTAKGSVQRRRTIDLYQKELEKLYADKALSMVVQDVGQIAVNGTQTVSDQVRQILARTTNIDIQSAGVDTSLFEYGLDSLQAMTLARELNSLLGKHGKAQTVTPRIVYANPTITRLTTYIETLVADLKPSEAGSEVEQMQDIYSELTFNLPVSARAPLPSSGTQAVLLTGSTGSLGSYILDALLHNPQVTAVYCLNRGPDSAARQVASNKAKGLTTSLSNAYFYEADFSKPYFGLDRDTYTTLLNEVTTIIHNAWPVDFNLPLSAFRSHIRAVRHLIDFSSHSRFGSRIVFISSISTVSNISSTEPVKEHVPTDWNYAQQAGYGRSKLVTERLLDAAARETGLEVAIFRSGQIAGPTTKEGAWQKAEWFPRLLMSSKYLGKLPASLGVGLMKDVDWVPVDVMGRVTMEVAFGAGDDAQTNDNGAKVFHARNPRTTTWDALLPTVKEQMDSLRSTPVEIVSLTAWVDALRSSAGAMEDVEQNPAIKLLDFFEGLQASDAKPLVLDVSNTVRVSKSLAGLGPVTNEDMVNWVRQLLA